MAQSFGNLVKTSDFAKIDYNSKTFGKKVDSAI